MKNLYNRVENLDELIRSVKLPYLAWKTLFLINKKADSGKIADLLETDKQSVSNTMQLLMQNGLIILDEEVSTEAEVEETKTTEDVIEPVVEDVSDQLIEEDAHEEDIEPIVEESAEIIEEQEAVSETTEPLIDEEDQQNADDVLDELMGEAEEQGLEEGFENLLEQKEEKPEEVETLLEETETEPVEEEKIEINIPEGDESDDISDEMEFNFNLTGEEKSEEKEEENPPVDLEQEDSTDKSGYKKILVIDDSLVIRKMVEIALEEEEFNIETAVSGKEGLEVMDQTNPNLVILDMMLPDINGIEILKTIKASKGIPVIMLSGKDSPQMIETAKNEGAEEFLPKPFKDDDLVEKIKKLI